MKRAAMWMAIAVVLGVAMTALQAGAEGAQPPPYRSPFDLRFSPNGSTLAVSDRTAGALVLVDVAGKKVAREVALKGEPTGVAWSADGSKVYVAEYGAATVAEVDAATGKVLRRFDVGLR
ncbi:MAG: hypothetical protein IMZ55_11545, partial [Acidobacteria bacterium]|nr:hypothetical protein [Acidobacteriota bacterium]